MSGGVRHRVLGNDIYDVGGHITSYGGDDTNLVPSNHLYHNNHLTMRYQRGKNWQVAVRGTGDRFSHNLVHDAPGQV